MDDPNEDIRRLKEQNEELKERIRILQNRLEVFLVDQEEADKTIAKLRVSVKHWKLISVQQYSAGWNASNDATEGNDD